MPLEILLPEGIRPIMYMDVPTPLAMVTTRWEGRDATVGMWSAARRFIEWW